MTGCIVVVVVVEGLVIVVVVMVGPCVVVVVLEGRRNRPKRCQIGTVAAVTFAEAEAGVGGGVVVASLVVGVVGFLGR